MVEPASEHLKEVLSMSEANLAKARADLALKKEKRKLEETKAKEELAKAKKEAKETIDKYEAYEDFVTMKICAVAIFHELK